MAERHPASELFHQVLRDAGDMHDKKQKDYGSDEDPFANVRSAEDFGLPGWVGAAIRMGDKLSRIKAAARNGPEALVNESLEDSFLDLLVYAGIGLVLFRQSREVPITSARPTGLCLFTRHNRLYPGQVEHCTLPYPHGCDHALAPGWETPDFPPNPTRKD